MISDKDFANNCSTKLYNQLGLKVWDEKGTVYSHTGITHPLLNGVLRCNSNEKETENVVKKVINYFEENKLPHSWWVESTEAPKNLKFELEKRGLNYLGDFSVMSINLKETKLDLASSFQTEIIEVKNRLWEWGNILSQSFQISELALKLYVELMQMASEAGTFINVMAIKEGRGVATGSITFTEDGGYICNDCTLEKERNVGYGKAVTTKLLEIAQQRGCTRVAVISAPSEYSDYLAHGFVEQSIYQIYM